MAFRDTLAKLRSLGGEKGYRLEKAPIPDCGLFVDGPCLSFASGTALRTLQERRLLEDL